MSRLTGLLAAGAVAAVLIPTTAAAAAPVASAADNPWLERRVLNIAHQGGELEAPSDTLYAFKTALDKGADVLELDVHATADGELVVLHDTTVDRTTNGTGRVDGLTLAQIRALDASYWFVPGCGTCHDGAPGDYVFRGVATGERPAPAGYTAEDFRIPTLREVLEAFPGVLINVEIKRTRPETSPYERTMADLLREFGRGTDTVVASFSDSAVTRFKLYNRDVSTSPGTAQATAFWLNTLGPLTGITLHGHHALQVPPSQSGIPVVTADFVADAHRRGLAVHVWTINDRAQMERLIDLGVDGIMTDRPTLLEQVLQERDISG
ncbi:glycerophosphodiester phosphodiesterase [Jiangella alkaliphila]|uniref:Glycerophosphoryl diester phosphodiesterase n=1 Tax=Jiangella alkaliphila TaxID=419479 RepID=A0A1H2IXP9_9ACTN|nr:glycerophosphodiester phosphodiesterase [Jiangella alkaliphila]SDU48705.1 glycerophosphoryl diester phosphodiesterase [Jiangella alkaliphila]